MRELARLPIPIVLTPGVVHLAVRAGAPESQPRRHGHGRQGVRRGARHPRARRPARLRRARRRRSSCSSSAARSRRRSPSRTAGSSTAWAERPGRSARARPARSTARWRFSPAPCPSGLLFTGGAAAIAGTPDAPAEAIGGPAHGPRGRLAWEAYLESAVKAVVSLAVSAPRAREVILSGRFARIAGVRDELTRRLVGRGCAAGSACSPASPRSPSRRRRARRCSPTVSPADPRRPSWTRSAFATRPARCSIICTSSRRQPRERGSELPEMTPPRARRGCVDPGSRRIRGPRRFSPSRPSTPSAISISIRRWPRTRSERKFSARAAARAARGIECDAVVYLSSFENHPESRRARSPAAGRCGAIRRPCSGVSAIRSSSRARCVNAASRFLQCARTSNPAP